MFYRVIRIVFFSICFSFLSLSCSDDIDISNDSCFRTEAFFFQNKQLEVNVKEGLSTYVQRDGKGQVFIYAEVNDCAEVADDEVLESIVFAIAEGTDKFDFSDDELTEIKCNYETGGAWVMNQSRAVKNGNISGEKISENIWKIKANVIVDTAFSGQINKAFSFDRFFVNR